MLYFKITLNLNSTRCKNQCSILGLFMNFKETMLPTCAAVLKHYFFVRKDLKLKFNNKEPTVKNVRDIVFLDLKHIWQKASIPTVSDQEIICLIKINVEKYKNIKKTSTSRKSAEKLRNDFVEYDKCTLFDIAICKYSHYLQCKCSVKISILERNFLVYQRYERKL